MASGAYGRTMSGYRFDRLKILVVDDNQHMRKLVVTILQAFGAMQIFEAADGEHAWAALRDSSPDVIILDWQMEGMNGLDFARQVRTSPNSPNPFVPIIMLTGHTHVDHVRQAHMIDMSMAGQHDDRREGIGRVRRGSHHAG